MRIIKMTNYKLKCIESENSNFTENKIYEVINGFVWTDTGIKLYIGDYINKPRMCCKFELYKEIELNEIEFKHALVLACKDWKLYTDNIFENIKKLISSYIGTKEKYVNYDSIYTFIQPIISDLVDINTLMYQLKEAIVKNEYDKVLNNKFYTENFYELYLDVLISIISNSKIIDFKFWNKDIETKIKILYKLNEVL